MMIDILVNIVCMKDIKRICEGKLLWKESLTIDTNKISSSKNCVEVNDSYSRAMI
jgi:hypothetical protein